MIHCCSGSAQSIMSQQLRVQGMDGYIDCTQSTSNHKEHTTASHPGLPRFRSRWLCVRKRRQAEVVTTLQSAAQSPDSWSAQHQDSGADPHRPAQWLSQWNLHSPRYARCTHGGPAQTAKKNTDKAKYRVLSRNGQCLVWLIIPSTNSK